MTEYRMVSTHTLEGQKEAERLHAAGWKTVRVGLFAIWFERKKGNRT